METILQPRFLNGTRPGAGVAIAAKDHIHIQQAPIDTKLFKEALEEGRGDKYSLDLGWQGNLHIFVIYGQTGGSRAALMKTETIIDAVKEETTIEPCLPPLVVGDQR